MARDRPPLRCLKQAARPGAPAQAATALPRAAPRPAPRRRPRSTTSAASTLATRQGLASPGREPPSPPRFRGPASRRRSRTRARTTWSSPSTAARRAPSPRAALTRPTRSRRTCRPGQHTLVLTKRTEANVGVVQLLGCRPQGGALVPSPDPFIAAHRIRRRLDHLRLRRPRRRPELHFSADTEDETVAYGSARGGRARRAADGDRLFRARGCTASTADPRPTRCPSLFDLTLPDDATSTWGFTTPPPDLVVINLSSNDFATGDPGDAFVQAYVGLLADPPAALPERLRALRARRDDGRRQPRHRRGATSREWSIRLATPATRGCRRCRFRGDAGTFFGFATQLPSDGYGCDYHPSVKTQQLMGSAADGGHSAAPGVVGRRKLAPPETWPPVPRFLAWRLR